MKSHFFIHFFKTVQNSHFFILEIIGGKNEHTPGSEGVKK
jgi:hypothetical protein